MKTPPYLTELKTIAPHIAIEIVWEPDQDATWDIEDPEMKEEDYEAWQSTVRASVIAHGELVSGEEHLCSTWEKYGDKPAESNPDISGYLPQMIQGALRELGEIVGGGVVLQAFGYMEQIMRERYKEQAK